MSDQFRDTCVNRQNLDRGTEDPIRVSFYDKDKEFVNEITRKEARCIASQNPSQEFYFMDGDGYIRKLLIDQVNSLVVKDQLQSVPECPSEPQFCGPPKVQFFGGNGIGAVANAIVSPISSSIIGFDFKSRGFNYTDAPFAQIIDDCGNGSGASLSVQMQPVGISTRNGREVIGTSSTIAELSDLFGEIDTGTQIFGQEIKNIVVKAPGDKYLAFPDGSLGGNERVWKLPNEGYVRTKDGKYYIVPEGQTPTDLSPEDEFFPPQIPTPEVLPPGFPQTIPPTTVTLPPSVIVPTTPPIDPLIPSVPSYPVVLDIEEVFVEDGGFGYQPGDTMTVVPDNGAIVEPIINDRGEIERVNVINPGIGFVDIPEIFIDSETGYNARLIPVLRSTPLSEIPDPTILPPDTQLISVVDCVGKIAPKSEFDIIPR